MVIAAVVATLLAAGTNPAPAPKASLDGLIGVADYPKPARARALKGTMVVELDINSTGRAVRCRRLASAGSPILDAATCRLLLERARFDPARNEVGQSIAGVYKTSVAWPR